MLTRHAHFPSENPLIIQDPLIIKTLLTVEDCLNCPGAVVKMPKLSISLIDPAQ